MSEPSPFEEYKLSLERWKHQDLLRQQRNSTFLTLNGALLLSVGLLLGTDADPVVRAGATALAAIVGLVLCSSWWTVQARYDAFIQFRRLQLLELERELGFRIITQEYEVFHKGGSVKFLEGPEFRAAGRATRDASIAEARLPLVLVALWSFGLAGATVALIVAIA